MKTIIFQGYSDDTFGWTEENRSGDEHDNCATERPIIFRVSDGPEAFLVVGHYWLTGGTWTIGVSQTSEDQPVPEWATPTRVVSGSGYSVAMYFTVPDSASIEHCELEAV